MALDNNIDPNTVYISFNSKDKELVEEFCSKLTNEKIPYECSVEPIDDKVSDFENKIGFASIVVIFYRPDYFKSFHCMNEYALVRKNEVHNKLFTVRSDKFVFDNIYRDLVRFWCGEEGVFRYITTNHTKVQEAAKIHDFYLQPTHPYSIHNLSSFFRDDSYYTEKNLDDLVQKVRTAYLEKSGKTVLPEKKQSNNALPCDILVDIDKKKFVPRKDVELVQKSLMENKIVNVVGIGGCGKSTISILYLQNQEYRDQYSSNNITDIIINGDVYQEFCDRFVRQYPVCQWVYSQGTTQPDYKQTFDDIINHLAQCGRESDKPCLFVLDVNETADADDYAKVRSVICDLEKYCIPHNWKLLVLSRVPLCDRLSSIINKPNGYIDISRFDKIDFSFVKELFFDTLNIQKRQYYQTFKDDELVLIFNKLGNLPILVKALAEFLNTWVNQTSSDIASFLGVGNLSDDMKGLDCTSVNKPIVYEKIGNFLSKLCRFSTLANDTQKHIVRHMMLWASDYYPISLIQRLVFGTTRMDAKFIQALLDLEHKCWLDSKENNETKEMEYKMHGLIAGTCKNQVFDTHISSTDDRGNLSSKPNPDYDANEFYRDYTTYVNIVRDIISTPDGITPIMLPCLMSFDSIYYSWLDTQPEYSYNISDNNSQNAVVNDYIRNMVKVPKGSFIRDGRPVVLSSDFYLGKTQVTQKLWDAVMKDRGFSNPSYYTPDNDRKKGKDTSYYPVDSVSWYDSLAFIMNLNEITGLKFSLPTEEQWEYAAGWRKDGRRNQFSGTDYEDELHKYAWYGGGWDNQTTHEVATRRPNVLGIYDMSGNVWEWCQDLYESSGSSRVLRGGSWSFSALYCRVSYRDRNLPVNRFNDFGMRLALVAP